jgi:murein DD-endopeptidase MepM/ murein hydrolase activator NlpD
MRAFSLIGIAALAACGTTSPGLFEKPGVSTPLRNPTGAIMSQGVYRLPYVDGSRVSVFDDARTHRPITRIDLVGEPRQGQTHRIVAAAAGIVMATQDGFAAQQSGRAAADCRNNYLWIAHPNGEWTLYSHMRHGTSTGDAGLSVGQHVTAGQYLGDEGSVGCAMLSHLHFEVAVPAKGNPIDGGGFITDNSESRRNRVPRFCLPETGEVTKDAEYLALRCERSPR